MLPPSPDCWDLLWALSLFGCQRNVLVWRRVGMAGDQAQAGLGDARPDAVDERQLPDRRIDVPLLHELLNLMQDRFALLGVELGRLLFEEGIDIGIVAVDIGATLHHERLQPRRRIAESAAGTLDQVLVGLLRIA